MPKFKRSKSIAQQLESISNPQGRVDVLGYGVAKKAINGYENNLGVPVGTLFDNIKEPIAKVANTIHREVVKMGVNPDLLGLGLGLVAIMVAKGIQSGTSQTPSTTQQVPQESQEQPIRPTPGMPPVTHPTTPITPTSPPNNVGKVGTFMGW